MRPGDVLNGYRILTEPTNAGGGMSQWAFAEKEGGQYFVKMFLAPKVPSPDGPGSPAAKERKRAVCLDFERRHLEIAGRLDPAAPGGGHLVVPCDFFRVESTYVKVMPRIHPVEPPPPHQLTGQQLLVILRTLAFSLRLLHQHEVVHGDLKPDNLLLEQTAEDLYLSKLIDFDEAYLAGQPPPAELIVGDSTYYSPEVLRYIKRDASVCPADLGTASDMFSLGLLLHVLLVGGLPTFDRLVSRYPCEAIVAGHDLDLSAAPEPARELLGDLLRDDAVARPGIDAVIDFLSDVDADALVPAGPPPPAPAPAPAMSAHRPIVPPSGTVPTVAAPAVTPPAPGGLRSTMGRRPRPETNTTSEPDSSPGAKRSTDDEETDRE